MCLCTSQVTVCVCCWSHSVSFRRSQCAYSHFTVSTCCSFLFAYPFHTIWCTVCGASHSALYKLSLSLFLFLCVFVWLFRLRKKEAFTKRIHVYVAVYTKLISHTVILYVINKTRTHKDSDREKEREKGTRMVYEMKKKAFMLQIRVAQSIVFLLLLLFIGMYEYVFNVDDAQSTNQMALR